MRFLCFKIILSWISKRASLPYEEGVLSGRSVGKQNDVSSPTLTLTPIPPHLTLTPSPPHPHPHLRYWSVCCCQKRIPSLTPWSTYRRIAREKRHKICYPSPSPLLPHPSPLTSPSPSPHPSPSILTPSPSLSILIETGPFYIFFLGLIRRFYARSKTSQTDIFSELRRQRSN